MSFKFDGGKISESTRIGSVAADDGALYITRGSFYSEMSSGGISGSFFEDVIKGVPANKKGDWDNSKLALDIGGGLYGVMQDFTANQDKWLGSNGRYYSNSWGGNQYTGSRAVTLKAAAAYKWAGRAALGATVVIGGIETYGGVSSRCGINLDIMLRTLLHKQ